ncbi:MAG TPA: hypothetical protein VIT67_07595 [Povalibacter sp.]
MTVVSSLWIGDSLSPLERACVQSFLMRGYEFDLYAYGPLANVPAGCRVLDAATVLPATRIIRYTRGPGKGSVALFSNMFRYKLLHEVGGWWVDMDMFCFADSLPDAGVVLSREDSAGLNCAIMRFPQGHALLHTAYDECLVRGSDVEWGETGPQLLTRLAVQLDLMLHAFPEQTFYPLGYRQFWFLFDPRRTAFIAERLRGAACIHLWHNMITRANLDKSVLPPEGSMLHNFYEWTIGTAGFTEQYVLEADCPADELKFQIVRR